MSSYLTLSDIDVSGKKVLVRSDLNVPLDEGRVADDFRIVSALPTLEQLVAAGAEVTVCSHLGRPRGPDPALSLRSVADRMDELSRYRVSMEPPADIVVLENTRFDSDETANGDEYAKRLASGVDYFVQDAFGSVHRAHASTVGVAQMVKSVAGPLLHAELTAFSRFTGDPDRPYAVVLGGAKVSDKLGVIENLLPKVDVMLIGGGMCFTLLAAKGLQVGRSIVEESMIERVKAIVDGSDKEKVILPSDIATAESFSEDAVPTVVDVRDIGEGAMGLDIGPETARLFAGVIRDSDTVFWNGPMGVFEFQAFRSGTESVARALAETEGYTVVGGGDSAAALRELGLEGEVFHLSTGGGAGLELLEGRELPGVSVLERWV